jgi:hypothetical protein
MKFGYPEDKWNAAKEEIRAALIETARQRGMITYGDLVDKVKAIAIPAHGPAIGKILGEISCGEDAQGRGMLTIIVVHKYGDMEPGPGFFELARDLGRDTSDVTKCWVEELKRVYAYWRDH